MKKKKKAYYEIEVDSKIALPVYEQVKRAIKLGILSGRLQEGQKLLTLRKLAEKLNINPNTIIKIYFQLEKEGFVFSRPGSGYYVQLDREKMKGAKQEFFADENWGRSLEGSCQEGRVIFFIFFSTRLHLMQNVAT
jgi:GntR family transcriptional regulator